MERKGPKRRRQGEHTRKGKERKGKKRKGKTLKGMEK